MNLPLSAPRTHNVIDPAILYFGTPVVLLGTASTDGHENIALMSSVFWLGSRAVLGMGSRSQTARNLMATRECVLNLPSVREVDAVDALALTTGRTSVPPGKDGVGYRSVGDKFAHAGLTAAQGETVRAPRALECPVNLEGRVIAVRRLGDPEGAAAPQPARGDEELPQGTYLFEVDITRVHVHPDVRMAGTDHRVEPDAWRPLIMSFQQFYGLGERVRPSRLAGIEEEWYR